MRRDLLAQNRAHVSDSFTVVCGADLGMVRVRDAHMRRDMGVDERRGVLVSVIRSHGLMNVRVWRSGELEQEGHGGSSRHYHAQHLEHIVGASFP